MGHPNFDRMVAEVERDKALAEVLKEEVRAERAHVPRRAVGPRKLGRPARLTHSADAIASRFRALRLAGLKPTQQELADNLEPKIGLRTLQDHLRRYGLAWPIE